MGTRRDCYLALISTFLDTFCAKWVLFRWFKDKILLNICATSKVRNFKIIKMTGLGYQSNAALSGGPGSWQHVHSTGAAMIVTYVIGIFTLACNGAYVSDQAITTLYYNTEYTTP